MPEKIVLWADLVDTKRKYINSNVTIKQAVLYVAGIEVARINTFSGETATEAVARFLKELFDFD